MKETGLLYGKDAIVEYLGVSEFITNRLINDGLPVLIDNKKYIAHKDNIEDWLRHKTRKRSVVPVRKKTVKKKDL